MAGLKWKHINFKKKELVIKDAIVRIETEYEKGTKTSTSNRVIRQIKCGLIPQIKNDFLRYAEAL